MLDQGYNEIEEHQVTPEVEAAAMHGLRIDWFRLALKVFVKYASKRVKDFKEQHKWRHFLYY